MIFVIPGTSSPRHYAAPTHSLTSFTSSVKCHLLPKALCKCSQCHNSQNPKLLQLLCYFYSKNHILTYSINYCHFLLFIFIVRISKQNSHNDLKSVSRTPTLTTLPSTQESFNRVKLLFLTHLPWNPWFWSFVRQHSV